MKENNTIKTLFEDLFDGDPWLDITILGTLQDINSEQALKRLSPKSNSIWEIVNHLIDWRLNVLQRVQGQVLVSPNDNYFKPVKDTSEQAWKETIQRLKDSQSEWTDFLEKMDTGTFPTIYKPNNLNYYQHIHGILQHDAYHLGQITLLAKYA